MYAAFKYVIEQYDFLLIFSKLRKKLGIRHIKKYQSRRSKLSCYTIIALLRQYVSFIYSHFKIINISVF